MGTSRLVDSLSEVWVAWGPHWWLVSEVGLSFGGMEPLTCGV